MCTKTREAPSILSTRVIRTHRVNAMETFRLQERLQLIDQELLQIYCQHCTDIQDVRCNLAKIQEVKKGMEISVERRKLLLSKGFRIVPSTAGRDTPLVIKTNEDGNQTLRGSLSESGFHDGRTLPWEEDQFSCPTNGRQTPGFNKVTQFRKIIPPFHVGSRRNFIQTYTLAKASMDKAITHVEESSDGNTTKRMKSKRPKTASSASLLRVHNLSSSKNIVTKRPQSTPIINIEETGSFCRADKPEEFYNSVNANKNSDDEEILNQFKSITSSNNFIDNNMFDESLYDREGTGDYVRNTDGNILMTKGDENKQRNDTDINRQVSRYLSVEQSGTQGQYQLPVNDLNPNQNTGKEITGKEFRGNEFSNKQQFSQHEIPKTSTPLRERNSWKKKDESLDNTQAENHFLMLSEMKEVKTREQLMNQRSKSPHVEAWAERLTTAGSFNSPDETFVTNMTVNLSRPASARSNMSISRPGSAQSIRQPSRPGSAQTVRFSRPDSAQSVRSRPCSARINTPLVSPTSVNFASKVESIITESPSERGRKEAIIKKTHRPRVTKETVYDARPNKALSHGYSTMQMTIGNRQVKIYVPKFATDEIVGNARAKSAAKKAAFGHAKKI